MSIKSRRKNHKLERKSEFLQPYDLILIVSEGEETEPNYFNKMIIREKLSSANVKVTGECGSDPVSVVKHAIKLFEIRENEINSERKFDRVYCLIDRDEHANFNEALNRINQYNKQKSKNVIVPILSFPCFEFWYICHFEDASRSPINRKGNKSPGEVCESNLNILWKRDFGKNYNKSDGDIYQLLESRVEEAIRRSTRFAKDAIEIDAPNPSTNIHCVVEKLLKLKRKHVSELSI